jgi:diguanylate cyclase (GGDEF)-like protein/PAS domain S-box-containing protein
MHYLEYELHHWLRTTSHPNVLIEEIAGNGLWLWNLEQPEHTWINERFWKHLGYDPQQQLHLTSEWQSRIDANDLQCAAANWNRYWREPDRHYDQFLRFRHAQGYWVWLHCRGVAHRDTADNIVWMLFAITDASDFVVRHQTRLRTVGKSKQKKSVMALAPDPETEIKDTADGDVNAYDVETPPVDSKSSASRLQQRLNETEANFRTFFNALTDFLFIIDHQGHIVYINAAFEKKLGYHYDELHGRNLLYIHPKSRHGEAITLIDEMLNGLRKTCPIPLIAKDGTLYPVETRVYPGTWNGTMALLGVARDLSELKATEEKFFRLFSFAPVAMVLTNLNDASIIEVNTVFETIIGYHSYEAVNHSIAELKIFVDHAQHDWLINQLKIQSEIQGYEVLIKTKDGRVLIGLFSARLIELQAKILVLTCIVDVTATKRAEATLAKEKRRLNALIESIPDLVWFKDIDGVYLACNSRFENYIGAPKERIIGHTDSDLLTPEQAQQCHEHDLDTTASGTPTIHEQHLRFNADGHREWVEIIETRVTNHTGEQIGVLGIARDISERKAREEAVMLLARVFSSTHDGIVICDSDEKIIDVNPAFTDMTGYSKNEVLGRTPRLLSSGRQDKEFYIKMWNCIHKDGFWKGEFWNCKKNGALYAVQCNISILRDSEGDITHYISVFSDITALKLQQEKLDRLAHYDALTQLPNRHLLADRLEMALSRAHRNRSLLAICFIDLDRFKPINDGLGHDAGDEVLIQIAQRLKEQVREDDTVARLGGDEFVLLLNDSGDPQNLRKILTRIIERVNAPMWIRNERLQVHASIGVALSTSEPVDAGVLLRYADQAMYRAKQLGRNQFQIFDAELDASIKERHQEQCEIRQALQEEQMVLHYQPMIDFATGQVWCVEALIRWHHPERGLLQPNDFLPQVAATDLAVQLDHWAIKQAIIQELAWQQAGYTFKTSINLTGSSLLRPGFSTFLRNTFAAYPAFNPKQMMLEILESAAIEDLEQVQQVAKTCAEFGIELILDDFGTGYSALSYLRQLPIRYVKIDYSFVVNIADDADAHALMASIVQLLQTFDKQVAVEGVENEAIGIELIRMGCHIGQGFAIAPPLSVAEIPDWFTNWRSCDAWQK